MNYLSRREHITSPHNPLLKAIRRAAAQGGLTADGLCLAEGPHLLEEALRSGLEIEAIVATENAISAAAGAARNTVKTRFLMVESAVFRAISTTENPQGVLSLVRPPVWTQDDLFRQTPLILVLDGLQDPGNAGTLLRAAEAFGATGAMLLNGTVSPWNPKTLRASAGSLFRLPMVDSLTPAATLAVLASRGVAAWTTVMKDGLPVNQVDLSRASAVVIGSEAHGISPELRKSLKGIMIPTMSVESLNAAVAGAVVLYEAARQRGFQ
jgi:TrmH family RNA methyltransferase